MAQSTIIQQPKVHLGTANPPFTGGYPLEDLAIWQFIEAWNYNVNPQKISRNHWDFLRSFSKIFRMLKSHPNSDTGRK